MDKIRYRKLSQKIDYFIGRILAYFRNVKNIALVEFDSSDDAYNQIIAAYEPIETNMEFMKSELYSMLNNRQFDQLNLKLTELDLYYTELVKNEN